MILLIHFFCSNMNPYQMTRNPACSAYMSSALGPPCIFPNVSNPLFWAEIGTVTHLVEQELFTIYKKHMQDNQHLQKTWIQEVSANLNRRLIMSWLTFLMSRFGPEIAYILVAREIYIFISEIQVLFDFTHLFTYICDKTPSETRF